ncbi:MAG TPA: hypothetical protein VK932_17535 [Kofleriaceae bacterium]|nr:hypothetical protein [Kofleriaceae bacterium]
MPSPSWRADGIVSTETSNQRVLRHGAYAKLTGAPSTQAAHTGLPASAVRSSSASASGRWASEASGESCAAPPASGSRAGSGRVCRIARTTPRPAPRRAAARSSVTTSNVCCGCARASASVAPASASPHTTISRARSLPTANPGPSSRRQLAGSDAMPCAST